MPNEQAAPKRRRKRRGALPQDAVHQDVVTPDDAAAQTQEVSDFPEEVAADAPEMPPKGALSEDFPAEEIDPAEQARRDEEALTEKLQAFGSSLATTRDRWIVARRAQGVDRRWRDDNDQYHGIDEASRAITSMMEAVENGGAAQRSNVLAHRSTVFIGLSRQKTNAGEARLSDILIPSDDRNWGISPTPNPDLAGQMQDETPAAGPDGQTPMQPMVDPATGAPAVDAQGQPMMQPMRKKDIAAAIDKQARDAAEAMEREIDDALTECDYHGELRKVIHDAALLGTGVIKGPIVTDRTRKAWVPTQTSDGRTIHALKIVRESSPASYRVDPRNVIPDPSCGDNVQKGRGIFERELMTKRAVQELGTQETYLKPALRRVLQQPPSRTKALDDLGDSRTNAIFSVEDDLYEAWHYVGEIDINDLRAAGVDGLPEEGEEDPLTVLSGCVTFINGIVVKAYMNPLETGDLPYDFYSWEKVTDSVWGYGIPYLMRAQQRVMNAAWRQMMDNSGLSSGPMLVMKQSGIFPADGQWTMHARKFWWAADDVEDVEKAMQIIDIPSHQAEMQAIIVMAQDLADKETGSPQLAQGEQGSAPDTVGGMQLLMNNANVVLRRLVKQFDDYVTKPHIRRYYDYFMAYSPKSNIKGDFAIQAHGSSSLLVRDAQNQALSNLLQLAMAPGLAPIVKLRDLFIKVLQAQHLPYDDIVKTEEEIKTEAAIAAKNPPQDPRIQAAMIVAQSRERESKAKEAGFISEIELRKDIANQNHASNLLKLQVERDLEMLKLANSSKLSLDQIKAQLATAAGADRTKKELAAAEMSFKEDPANESHTGI